MKKKPLIIVAITIPVVLIAGLVLMLLLRGTHANGIIQGTESGMENNPETSIKSSNENSINSVAELYCTKCKNNVKGIVSAELVSQEKPLVFYDLMERPKIEGVKVKLTYNDGSSETVDAYEAMEHYSNVKSSIYGYQHRKGMFFDIGIFQGTGAFRPKQTPLPPGLNRIAMYCVDAAFGSEESHWELSRNPEETGVDGGLAYCMVEVYAQTAQEYMAENKPSFAAVTETNDAKLSLKRGESGLIQLSAKENGMYLLQIDGDYRFNKQEYDGSGVFIIGRPYTNEKDRSNSYYDYYVRLNPNEPMYVQVKALKDRKASLRASMTRLPEVTIAVGETVTITQPVSLRIKDYDSEKVWNDTSKDLWQELYWDGCYLLSGKDYSQYAYYMLDAYEIRFFDMPYGFFTEHLQPACNDQVIVPEEGKTATVTLRLGNTAMPDREIRMKIGESHWLRELVTTDFRGSISCKIEPAGVFELQDKNGNAYVHALKKGEATLTIGKAPKVLGTITIIVE